MSLLQVSSLLTMMVVALLLSVVHAGEVYVPEPGSIEAKNKTLRQVTIPRCLMY